MKILNFKLSAVKSEGVKVVEGVEKAWSRLDIYAESTNGVKAVKLTLWGRQTIKDYEDGTSKKLMVYQSSPVEKGSKLRKKWWVPVSANNPALITTTSSKGNTYKEVLAEDVEKGFDIKAFYSEEKGKIGVSVKYIEEVK